MSAPTTSLTTSRPRPLPAILWGGLAVAVLDIGQAFIAWGLRGVSPVRILQSVAAGAVGRQAAFGGGWKTALLGALFHCLIALTIATVYWIASRRLSVLTRYPYACGLLYGEAVFCVMYFVVMPLSKVGWPRFTTETYITGPLLHPFLVGLPVALIVRRYSR